MSDGKKTYTEEEVKESTIKYFSGDELATSVWASKYALRNKEGQLLELNPSDTHRRLAKEFARIEKKYPNPLSEDEIYSMFDGFKYVIPQGSPMSGIGNKNKLQSLSNCFVIPSPEDSYGGIFFADQQEAQIMKRRGGVGLDISKLRPKGAATNNAAITTDGIGVFMERYSNTCREVAQGGRRGALMISIDIRSPSIETFINIKRDKKKVTGANISVKVTDDFMRAVENNSEYVLRWPVDVPVEEAKITKTVNAKDVWDQIVDASWDSAEPGILFWDTAHNLTPSDIYESEGFKSVSVNPCLTYETKVAVADGREYVEIGKLAEEGIDVPVYALDDATGKVIIRTMRNPRITGKNVPIYKVTVEGGHSFRATENHKILLNSGNYCEIKDIKVGDSFHIMTKQALKFNEAIKGLNATSSQDYYWVNNSIQSKKIGEHRIVWSELNKKDIPKNHVIHHVDFNALNNKLDNLQCMSFDDHVQYHKKSMIGDANPMRRGKTEWSTTKWQTYHDNMSLATSGLKNGRSYSIKNEDIFNHAVKLSKQLGSKPSAGIWNEYAKTNKLPQYFSNFRLKEYKTFEKFITAAALQAGIPENIVELDPRQQRTINQAIKSGYEFEIRNSIVYVNKTCEECKNVFWSVFSKREIAFCGAACSNFYLNRHTDINDRRTSSINSYAINNAKNNKKLMLDVYTKLRFSLGKEPLLKDWANECRNANIKFRLGTKYGFKSWNDLKLAAENYNHRVISVEYCGTEDVYNGTVDDVHNFYFGGFEEKNSFDKKSYISFNNKQCGEIVLSPYDSCRLLVVNLVGFVDHPFEENAKFNFEKFDELVQKSQRLMDDLVDLELEAVDQIIEKIDADEEEEFIKLIEKDLWKKIREAGVNGRRTGLGITALGDALAMLGIRYGSPESIEMTEQIYKALALGAYRSSVKMAEQRGAFPVFSFSKEKDHEFINRIMNSDSQLKSNWKKFGRRNIALTTTAPVGSVSTLTQTTSGIEPAFLLSYTRRKKINPNEKETRIDFIDELGDKWQHFTIYHHCFKKWMDITGKLKVEDSPYYLATSNDVDWLASVKLQSVAQKWICHSISKTCNLPKTATHDLISQIYIEAWKQKCKGFTIYRDASRDGVLVSDANVKFDLKSRFDGIAKEEIQKHLQIGRKNINIMPQGCKQYFDDVENYLTPVTNKSEETSEFCDRHAPKRPLQLPCDIHRVKVKGESYLAFVGLLNDKPYELFCGLSEHVEVPKKIKRGFLVKNSKSAGLSTYNLKIPLGDDDEVTFKDVVTMFENQTNGAFTRTLSLALRHGTPIQYICEQLGKDKHSDMQSFSTVIARVLKTYIKDGTEVASEKSCPTCSNTGLIYQEGCITCPACGYSKCG